MLLFLFASFFSSLFKLLLYNCKAKVEIAISVYNGSTQKKTPIFSFLLQKMAMAVKEKGRNSMRDLLIAFQKKKARKNGNIESSFFVDIIALKTKHLFFVFHRVVSGKKCPH